MTPQSLDEIEELFGHEKFKVISFDMFDTLVTRPVERAGDVFRLLDKFYAEDFDKYKFKDIHDLLDKRKRGTLKDYVDSIDGAQELIDEQYQTLTKDIETGYHGGLYDTLATYVVFLYYLIDAARIGLEW